MIKKKLWKILNYIKMASRAIVNKNNPFSVDNMDDAKKVILADYGDFTVEHRWNIETEYELSELRKLIHENSTICDFGIGVGRLSGEILKEYKNVHIVGIDSSVEMLNLCKKTIPSAHHNRLQLELFNRMRIIKTGSIDFAFSIYTLQHIPKSLFEQALQELNRIMKPKAFIYILNLYNRCVVDAGKVRQWYEDGLSQLSIIAKYFEEVQDVSYQSEYMKEILKNHFSKLFRTIKDIS